MTKNLSVTIFMVTVSICFVGILAAADSNMPESAKNWKSGIKADKAAVKVEKEQMKKNAESAKVEERQMRQGVRQAAQSGDKEKAKELKTQLKATHKENVKQMKQDKGELRQAKTQLQMDAKNARKERATNR